MINAPLDSAETIKIQADGKLAPMIFVHGLMAKSGNYMGQCREIASHGYLVMAIDCIDGSC